MDAPEAEQLKGYMDTTLYPRFSEAEFTRRYEAIRSAMREADLSMLILYGTVSAYHEVLFLSNFPATREAMLIFPLDGEPALFVQYFNHVPNARQVASIADVRWEGPISLLLLLKTCWREDLPTVALAW